MNSLLQELYDSEINFEIRTFWDGGFDAALGDESNGFVAESNHDTFAGAELWLWAEAKKRYPDALCFKKEMAQ